MRKCNKCGLEKEPTEYHRDSKNEDGCHHTCKDCRRKIYGYKPRKRTFLGEYKGNKIVVGDYTRYPTIFGTKIRAHRFIMEDVLGRKLNTNEHVHHINGDTMDYSLENLIVLTASEHKKRHKTPKGEGVWASCRECGFKTWMTQSTFKWNYGGDTEKWKNYMCMPCHIKLGKSNGL